MDDQNVPATRGDLQDAVTQFRTEMNHHYDDLKKTIRDRETKLLQAFYSYAESNQKRMSAVETESAAIKSRLATTEDRLTAVEKRLNMPPAI